MNSKPQLQLDFDSDDTEGSDVSYESSFDEQLEQEFENGIVNQYLVLQQKQIVQFKDQMERMLQLNQDIGHFNLEKPTIDEEELKKYQNKDPYHFRQSIQKAQIQISPRTKSKSAPKQLPQWSQISKNILNNSKKVGTMPTLEEFQQRLNLFRKNNEKSDVVDLIIQEQEKIQKDIEIQAKRNKAIENAVHESIEAKVRKETGDVGYVSYRKKIQFQFRIRKAEELAQEKVEKQLRKKENDMLKSIQIFEQLFKDKNYEDEGDLKNSAAEELYKKVKKCGDDIEVKQTILMFIISHRKKQIEEYKNKPVILKPSKFISEDCREFSLLQPDMQFKAQMMTAQFNKEILENKEDLEVENIYLLTKINQILDGNLMKLWKNQLGSSL